MDWEDFAFMGLRLMLNQWEAEYGFRRHVEIELIALDRG